jgi:hypothetical protein
MSTIAAPPPELLAVVEVDKADRVACQATGCGHAVYKRIHVVRHDGKVCVYGSDCFGKLFANLLPNASPRYGTSDGRELTLEERRLLVENTERLLAQFEVEHQQALELARLRREQQEQMKRAAAEHIEGARREAERRRPPTLEQLAPFEREAKRMVREQYDVDPDAPGWRGLVLKFQRELFSR